jgi:hypothetical protein
LATKVVRYCARSPDVETDLRCGRCDVPICPSCLIQTPVGIRCPDCAEVVPPRLLRPIENKEGGVALIVTALAVTAIVVSVAYMGFSGGGQRAIVRAQAVPGPTFVVSATAVDCYEVPSEYSLVIREVPAGSIQTMVRYFPTLARVWYQEADQHCWTLIATATDTAPRTFFTREDAEAYGASIALPEGSPSAP